MTNKCDINQDYADGLPMPCRTWAMIALGCAVCMSILDSYIVNIILPSLARDFKVSPSTITWIVNGYQLAIVASILSFSSLAEIVGYRKIFLIGTAMFSVTSLICALSDSFTTLFIARILQGFSASAIMSVSTALIKKVFPAAQIGRGMGINAMIASISAASGPSIASGILAISSWHWLFVMNIPIAIIAFIIGMKYLPKTEHDKSRKFDIISAITNAVTFGLLFYTLDGFAHHGSIVRLLIQLVVVLGVGYYFIHRQLQQEIPLLPIDLLRIPMFRFSIFTSIFSFIAQMLAMITLPFFLQNTMKLSEVMTGLLLTPWPAAALFTAPLAGFLIEKVKPALVSSVGLAIFCGGLLLLSFLHADSSHIDVAWRIGICGMGFALFLTPNNSLIMASAPTKRSGGASGMLSLARLIGQTFGTTFAALLFSFLVQSKATAVCFLIASGVAMITIFISSLRMRKNISNNIKV